MHGFMNFIFVILFIVLLLFAVTFLIYWFNLDTKLVKMLEKPLNKHYDNIKRDRKI